MSNCPSLIELEAYLDVGSEVGVGPHIRTCRHCIERLAKLRDDRQFLQGMQPTAQRVQRSPDITPDAPDGYKLVRVIGRGGQAVVYEAIQNSTRRRVALKVVRLGVRDAARRRRRFEREAELVSSLRHPAIVTVFDSGITPEGDPFLVMEYIEGEPIGFRPDASLRERLEEFRQVCSAVRYAHQHGVVHRDLKPSNILIDSSGQPRVLDFGLATTVETRDTLTLTRSGEFLGTPIYAAPEQLRGDSSAPDVRTDVYALGVVLYQVLTGEHPFVPSSALADIVTGILDKDPARPSSRMRGLNHEIDTIVLKALAKEPARRYLTVDALEADLGRYLRGEPIEAKRDSTWYTLRKTARRHRWAFASTFGFILMLLGFGIVMAFLYRSAADTSRELADTLASRDLDQGIEQARNHDVLNAERLLWGEYLKWVETPEQVAEWSDGPLLHRRAHWALWELYHRQPCLSTLWLTGGRAANLVLDEHGVVWITDGKRNVHRWEPLRNRHRIIPIPNRGSEPTGMRLPRTADRLVLLYPNGIHQVSLSNPDEQHWWPIEEDASRWVWSDVAVFADDLILASGHVNGTARTWNLDQHTTSEPVKIADTLMNMLLVSDDQRVWGSGPTPRTFFLYDLKTGAAYRSPRMNTSSWLSVDRSGEYQVHSGRVWRGRGDREIVELEDRPLSRVDSHSFSSDAEHVLGRGTTTPVWDARTGKLIRVLVTHDANLSAMRDDTQQLVTVHLSGIARIWELNTDQGQEVVQMPGTVHDLQFSPDGSQLAIAGSSFETEAFLWLYKPGRESIQKLDVPHTGTVASVVWPQADRFYTAGHGGAVAEWSPAAKGWSGRITHRTRQPINELSYDPSEDMLALACNDGSIRLKKGREPLTQLGAHTARAAAVLHVPFRGWLSGGRDGVVRSWKSSLPAELGPLTSTIRALATHTKAQRMASGGDDQMIRVWDINGTLQYECANGTRVFALAFSPDGTLLASGDVSGTIRLWDVPSGTLLAELSGHGHMIFTLTFSPDGRLLASGGADGSVRLWELNHFERHIRGNLAYQRRLLPD